MSQYVTIGAASQLFAAPVDKVWEILELRPISRLPQAPSNLLGMIDVRGEGVPVLDFRSTIGLPPTEDDENTRIVVLRIGSDGAENTIGLKADRVFEVTVLDDDELEMPPEDSLGWNAHAVAGIGRRNGDFVTVLDMDKLLGGLSF